MFQPRDASLPEVICVISPVDAFNMYNKVSYHQTFTSLFHSLVFEGIPVCAHVCVYVCVSVCVCVCACVCVCERERDIWADRQREKERLCVCDC